MDDYLRKGLKKGYIDPKKLIPYEKNARTHGSELEFLKNNIKKHGFPEAKAIEVDENMVIICGHGRREAAIQLGMPKVPYLVRSDLSPEEVKAYRLSDNKIQDLSGWDFDNLHGELSELDDLGIDMTEFGFEDLSQFDLPDADDEDEEEGTPLEDLKNAEKGDKKDYRMIVICSDEADLLNLAEDLADKGYICQLL